MLKKGDGVAGTIPLLAQRAVEDSPRWTRAVGIIPPTPYKVIACCGLADELFEHPAEASLLVPYVQALEALLRETGFPQPHG